MKNIRNFCIIAHIDHGKSTLADRLIQACDAVGARDFRDQVLDDMDIERERGITIKSNSITLDYQAKDGERYQLNLIDTPGHVDFSHEVRRSLMACDGAIIIVDATQGVEAQTVANLYLAMEHELELLPIINKIDLPAADVERVREEIDADLGLDPFAAIAISAKNGVGVEEVLEGIVRQLPPPSGESKAPVKALVFDAQYDAYRGVVLSCRIRQGELRTAAKVRFMHTGREYEVHELGYNRLTRCKTDVLPCGAVGYIITGIKTIRDVSIGDTLTVVENPAKAPLPGYQPAKPVVFSSIYPMSTDEYPELTAALEKLALNDAALDYQKDSSAALGFGFRCGFLGLLHLDVVQERLKREFELSLVLSAPSVLYRVTLKNGTLVEIDNPANWPEPGDIDSVEEPYIKASILVPESHMGAAITLCRNHRAATIETNFLSKGRIDLVAEMPLAEVLFEFYDRLKSATRGYGSFDYEELDYRPGAIVKVDILVHHERVDALAFLAHADKARGRALHYSEQLAKNIPRHQFKIPVQGAIGGNIIARSTISAFRKDVTAKCYGGDVSRKRKLLEKQKKGKARMKLVGSVEIPQEAFVSVLRTDQQ
ncbi:MAG: elongation factor 4 [Gammaproteobacteria bacterium]|nr:elongation factor 4 [Gammaproteobacteria bacterium]